MILSTGALRRRGVHGHAWPPVRWQADRRWPGVPVREPQTGSAPRGGPGVETEPAHPRRPALGWLCRPGADGASALRQRVAPVARLVRAGRAVLEGRALAADRSHPTQLGSGRSHAVD